MSNVTITVKHAGNVVYGPESYEPTGHEVANSTPSTYLFPGSDLSLAANQTYDVEISPNVYHQSGLKTEGGMIKRFELQDGGGGEG